MSNLDDIVRDAIAAHPFPAFADADAQTRRKVTREAESLGLDPETYYDRLRARAVESANFDAAAIAREARG